MATTSEVKIGLDAISTMIANSKRQLTQAKTSISNAKAQLANIPTQFADIIQTIDSYVGTDPFEALSKDEKALLATEFIALRDAATTAETSLSTITEF